MRTHPLLRLSLLFASLAALALPARSSGDDPMPSEAPFDFSAASSRAVAVHVTDGRATASGPGWLARLDCERTEVLPLFGGASDREWPLRLQVLSLGRDGYPVRTFDPGHGALTLALVHAGHRELTRALAPDVRETFLLLPEGVKHSVVIDSLPPGRGELVLRMRVETDLAPGTVDERGLTFAAPGLGGLQIEIPVIYDSAGRATAGELRFDGAMLEIVVPAEFVARAAAPLVIDPLIAPVGLLPGTTAADGFPDATYDPIARQWAVCWTRRVTSTSFQALVQRFDETGAPLGSARDFFEGYPTYSDFEGDARFVAVMTLRSPSSFLVAVHSEDPGPEPEKPRTLWLRELRTADGSWDGAWWLSTAEWSSMDMAGGGAEGNGLEWTGCLAAAGPGGTLDLFQIGRQEPNQSLLLTLCPFWNPSLPPGVEATNLRLANDAGSSGRWLSVWEQVAPGGRTEVHGALICASQSQPVELFAMPGADCTSPSVAGDGSDWVVVCRYADGGAEQLLGGRVRHTSSSPGLKFTGPVAELYQAPNVFSPVGAPELAWLGGEVVLAWSVAQSNGATLPTETDVLGMSLDADTLAPCEWPFQIGSFPSPDRLRLAAGAIPGSGFALEPAALLVLGTHKGVAGAQLGACD